MRLFRNNRWNRLVYFFWAPFFDLLVNARFFRGARQRAHDVFSLKAGDELLIVAVGTGADLRFLPEGLRVTGVDLSPAMLARARQKLPIAGCSVDLDEGDAADLNFAADRFDVVLLSLILTVAEDGARCLSEAVRVTRPGGRLLVFDKFLPPDSQPGLARRCLNLFVNPSGTDINRAFEPMMKGVPCRVLSDEPVLWGGFYRAIVLEKQKAE